MISSMKYKLCRRFAYEIFPSVTRTRTQHRRVSFGATSIRESETKQWDDTAQAHTLFCILLFIWIER